MDFNPFGSAKKKELVTLTAAERSSLDDPQNSYSAGNTVGIKSDIEWYLKRNPPRRPEQIANETDHTYQAVLSCLKDLEKEGKVEWTPY